MGDVVSPEKRSLMMSGIRNKDTKPEIVIRKGLHAMGYRYRLHDSSLPGKPDLVLRKYQAVIFIHGCFWHVHNCHLFKWPKSRAEWWRKKLLGNVEKDKQNIVTLKQNGWRVLLIWECALKGKNRMPLEIILEKTALWLEGTNEFAEIRGT